MEGCDDSSRPQDPWASRLREWARRGFDWPYRAIFIEPFRVVVERIDFPLAGLPPALDGFPLVQISDLHFDAVPLDYLRRCVRLVNALRPQAIVITGDFVDESRAVAPALADLLNSLRAPAGVLGILGNHDYGLLKNRDLAWHRPAADELIAGLRRTQVRLLVNEPAVLEVAGGRLQFAGLNELWTRRFDIDAALAGLNPRGPTIALCHNPDGAPALARRGCGLVLAGHTHGGQVHIPWLFNQHLPLRRKDLRAGLHRIGRSHVYVNRGLGFSRQIRWNARPEITLLRLRTK